jgi:integrase
MRLAVVLLYTTGLRRGELVRLILSDYDPAARTLAIRASKFHKSRVVALSPDATRELEEFLRARRRWSHPPDAPLLVTWRRTGMRAYSDGGLGQALRRLFRAAGVRTAADRPPRVHDLRHTYAVHALLRWYRQGVDVQAKLPTLATAMGHVSIASTAYYLALLPPVAEAASERFARHCTALLAAGRGDTR